MYDCTRHLHTRGSLTLVLLLRHPGGILGESFQQYCTGYQIGRKWLTECTAEPTPEVLFLYIS